LVKQYCSEAASQLGSGGGHLTPFQRLRAYLTTITTIAMLPTEM